MSHTRRPRPLAPAPYGLFIPSVLASGNRAEVHQGGLCDYAGFFTRLLYHGFPCPSCELLPKTRPSQFLKVFSIDFSAQEKRLFHILTAFITTFAAISYFGMAVKDGITYNTIHVVEKTAGHFPDVTHTIYREVYWARYVDWSVTTPLLLLDLSLLAGLAGANILVAIVADIIMILTGLFAAFTVEEGPKWGWYAMACIAYLVVVYQLGVNGRGVVQNKDAKTATFFSSIAGFTLILWTVYPM